MLATIRRAGITVTEKLAVLDAWEQSGNISAVLQAFYSELNEHAREQRRNLINQWRKKRSDIELVCQTAREGVPISAVMLHLQALEVAAAYNKSKERAIVMLLADSNGKKMAPFVVFKTGPSRHQGTREQNTSFRHVPPSATAVCQPADVAWNQPFKQRLRRYWVDLLQDQLKGRVPGDAFKLVPPDREVISNWIERAWAELSERTEEILIQEGWTQS
ncbi:Hypothetical protein PHPALM_21220 [Phytophthora palmivora]|uniref:DDE-1 domain-containing protein n=1 Tax=Phytophthora palmivora TaxID=4796 RepID=A0A2P4XCW9_9STRA|nr:Hypothetical protein PHPALM_21220 [Phytophthora palmivora]